MRNLSMLRMGCDEMAFTVCWDRGRRGLLSMSPQDCLLRAVAEGKQALASRFTIRKCPCRVNDDGDGDADVTAETTYV